MSFRASAIKKTMNVPKARITYKSGSTTVTVDITVLQPDGCNLHEWSTALLRQIHVEGLPWTASPVGPRRRVLRSNAGSDDDNDDEAKAAAQVERAHQLLYQTVAATRL